MSEENILVVDDAVVTLKLIATVLRNSGYKVQLHSTAEQALSSMNTMRPDLLLVDIQLPGMDGLERRSAPSASRRACKTL
jgi:CheY-like chemotaxis protein